MASRVKVPATISCLIEISPLRVRSTDLASYLSPFRPELSVQVRPLNWLPIISRFGGNQVLKAVAATGAQVLPAARRPGARRFCWYCPTAPTSDKPYLPSSEGTFAFPFKIRTPPQVKPRRLGPALLRRIWVSVLGEASSCPGSGLAHAERFAFGDHDDAVVQETVEQADGGGVFGQEPAPLVEGPVRADGQGSLLVGGGDGGGTAAGLRCRRAVRSPPRR
jgi:hypothetical protein